MDRQAGSNRGSSSGTSGSTSPGGTGSSQQTSGTSEVTDQLQQQASKLADTAQQQAEQQFRTQKQTATQGLGSVSDALHQAADQLRKQNQDMFAGIADEAANQLDQFSGYLQQENLHRVIDQVEGFARNQPYVFLGGAFALGVLAARFLKASRPESASWGRGSQQSGRYSGSQYGFGGRGYGYSYGYGPLNYPGVHYAGRQPYPSGFGATAAGGYGFGSSGTGTSMGTGMTGSGTGFEAGTTDTDFGRANAYGRGTTTGTGVSGGFNRGAVTTGSGVSHETSGDAMGAYPNVVSPEGGASTRLAGQPERRGQGQARENQETGNATE